MSARGKRQGRTSRCHVAALLCLTLGAGISASQGSCDAIRPPRKDRGLCDQERPCEEGRVCIPRKLGGSRGQCAKECKEDSACPKGERCSGRYQKVGTVERFCRRASVEKGEPCEAPLAGCQEGLRCFQGKCLTECAKDGDCLEVAHRCLPITVDTVVEKDRVRLFSLCLPAVEAEGKPCKPEGPFCGRGLLCHNGKCTRACAKDDDCPKGLVCDGALYVGEEREERATQRKPPDQRYCRQGAKKNRPCHHNLDVGCAAGLACIKFTCREVRNVGAGKRCDPESGVFCEPGLLCHEGACRKPCIEDRDCTGTQQAGEGSGESGAPMAAEPGRRGRRRARPRVERRLRKGAGSLKCREVLYRGQQQRVCM
ncbi:MAG: hypothetical protein RBU30_05360 [Polyangia bacterium]|jgi:hypothetical protein|nr:hypothetical protein [Polyangia bacterium]